MVALQRILEPYGICEVCLLILSFKCFCLNGAGLG